MTMTSECAITFDIVNFCAEECYLQGSGERSVAWMVHAWMAAAAWQVIQEDRIIQLGRMVEPRKNMQGFRTVEVRVGWQPVRVGARDVPVQVSKLVHNWNRLTPGEIFKEFEEIHPFLDGNGRVGQILFNWFNGTMDDPVMAPNFWDDPRRRGVIDDARR